jgi:hypothetical protein
MAEPHSNSAPSAATARRPIASFSSYAEAERAVDYLSDNEFPVERVQIVGRDLKLVEQVTGRLTHGLIGWLFTVFDWFNPVVARGWLILDGLWFGLLVGALYGLLLHWLMRGRRDFSSVPAMSADRYEVLVDDEVATQAELLLSRMRTGDKEHAAATSR